MKTYGGIIRWKFAVPFALCVSAMCLYVFLLMDQQLRWLLEKLATDANGAEVNVGSFRSSLSGLFVELQNIQVTDPESPEMNRLQITKLRFDLSAEGLIRSKLIIEDASLQDLQIQSKRAKPGRVLPPPAPEPEGPGLTEKAKQMLQPVKEELVQNALSVLKDKGLTDPLQGIVWEDMPSRQAIKQLQAEWDMKQQNLQSTLASLPKSEDFKALKAEAQAIKAPQDPTQLQASLASLEALKAKAMSSIGRVEAFGAQVKGEAKQLSSQLQGLDQLVKQDIAVVSQRLKLPDLDFKNLAEELCGPEIKRYIRIFEVYYAKLRPYLESKEKPAPSRPLRRAGTDLQFPVTQGLPSFWLKKMQLSSKETADGPLGDMLGKITDVSSDPQLLAQPTQIQIAASFRQMGVQGLQAEATLDHRRTEPKDQLKVSIASFPVADRVLAKAKDYTLGYYKAVGSLQMSLDLQGEVLQLQVNSAMRQLSWQVDAESPRVKSMLDSVFAPMQEFRIAAKAEGPWQALQWSVSSNLADQLRLALREALSKELAELQEKLKLELEKRLAEEKAKIAGRLQAQMKGIEDRFSPIEQEAGGTKNDLEAQKNQMQSLADQKKAELQNQAKAEQNKAVDKAKDQLKNQLKIPGL